MALTILSKKYTTLNQPTGNSFLLANSGQLIQEQIVFTVDFTFLSTTQNSVTFPSNYEIQLLGGVWSEYGFNVGDAIQLNGVVQQGSSTITFSSFAATVTDINGDTLTLDTNLDPAGSGILIGAIMPTSTVGTTPLTIVNTTASTPQALEIFHNIVENSASGSVNSLIDGEVNRFRTDVLAGLAVNGNTTLEQLGNKSGGSYVFSRLTRLSDLSGKKRYQIDLFYYFPYLFEDGSFDEPSFFEASQSLKPYFELYVIPQVNNPNAQLKLANGSLLGNVGWLNENYNQGVNDFTYELSIEDASGNNLDEIDFSQENNVTVKVYNAAAISNIIEAQFYMVPQTSTYKNKPQSHVQLIRYSGVRSNGVVPIYGQFGVGTERMIWSDYTFTQLTGYAEITFKLTPNAEFDNYASSLSTQDLQYRLTLTVQNTGGTANNNNAVTLNLKEGILTKNPVQGGIFSGLESQAFYDHVGDLSSDKRFTTEDDFIYQANFFLDKGDSFNSLTASIVIERDSDGAQFALLSKLVPFSPFITTPNGVTQINFTEPIQQFLDNPNANKLTLANTGVDSSSNYEVQLNWSLMANWRYWIAQNNAFLDFFNGSLPENGLNAEWMRYLRTSGYTIKVKCELLTADNVEYYWENPFSLIDYDTAEDQACDIKLFDATGTEQTAIIANQIMTVKAIFTTAIGQWVEPSIWGWLSIRPKEADPNKRLSTVWDWSSQDKPLQPQAGLTKVDIEQISTTEVHLVCEIDTSGIDTASTIIATINQKDDKGNFYLVHKQDFNKITLPGDAIREDKGAVFCSEPQLVVASLEDAAYYKNDRTGIAYKFDDMTIELEDANGNLSPAPGITVNFPHQPDAVGFVIDWRQVASGSVLLQGCYKVRVNWELSGNSGWFYYGSYNLVEYTPFNVLSTVRLFVVLNDLVRKQGINYKDSGFASTVRFRGQFGYMQPKYETENIIYTDRRREKVRNEALRSYELRSSYLLSCMTRLIDEECLLTANQIYISDHNANNHVQDMYYDFPVILSEEESPTFEYTDSVFAKIKAVFVDKVAYYESKYDGNIKGSDNIILQLPNATTGGGGICENATVHNSDYTYVESVVSGGDLELEDITFLVQVNGVFNQSVTLPSMADHTITIVP
jgi:hypothetical protein